MGRDTGIAENKAADASNAATAAAAEKRATTAENWFNQGVTDLSAGKAIGVNPYQAPDYLRNQNILTSANTSATNKGVKEQLQTEAQRTGVNTASRAATLSDLSRQNMRAKTDYQAGNAATDYDKYLDWEKMLLGSRIAPVANDTSMFSAATSGRASADKSLADIGISSNAMFGQILGSALGAAGSVASAGCPVTGAMLLISEGHEKAVEDFRKGDILMGADGEPDELIEDPQPHLQFAVEINTEHRKTQVSSTHTFERAKGGYSFAGASEGELLKTVGGPETVSAVRGLAEKVMCYHLLLKRSHGYVVDGFHSLE